MHRDFAFAFRQLRTNLTFSLIIMFTLALGIGATTAIFSVVSGVLLRALPFPESDRLISLQTVVFPHGEAATKEAVAGTIEDVSFPDFFDWRSQSNTLEAVALYAYGTSRKFTSAGNEPPRIVDVEYVSADFFRVLLNSVRAAVVRLNRDLPVFAVSTFDELIGQSTVYARFEAQLLTCFAVSALILAAVGLYAALSEMVARRTFEIGLRVALGAQQKDVFGLVVRRGLVLAAIGLTVGVVGFVIFGRVVADTLYGVRAFDPLTVAGACVLLLLVSLLASTAPAWRAARLQPTEALREQ